MTVPPIYELALLYERQDLSRKCIDLLNEEWPRSDGSREHSQNKSCRPTPPFSLLLIEKNTDILVGHARVCYLPNRPSSCWIESVIINRTNRGKGIGKYLMLKVEEYVKQFGFDQAYLSTHNQEIFYSRCGYVKCHPIVHSTTSTSVFPINRFQISDPSQSSTNEKGTIQVSINPMAPPPPPLPPKVSIGTMTNEEENIQYMHKIF